MSPAQKQTANARAARHARLTCGYTLTPKAIAALSPVMPAHGLVGISIYPCGCSLYRFPASTPGPCPMHGRSGAPPVSSAAPPTCGAWSCPARNTGAATTGDKMCRCSVAAIVAACEYWRREAERLRALLVTGKAA